MPSKTTINGAGIIFNGCLSSINDQMMRIASPAKPITAISRFKLAKLSGICAMVENKLPLSGVTPSIT